VTTAKPKIAIVFPADPAELSATLLARSRFAPTADALTKAGAEVIGAPYADQIVEVTRERLMSVDGALVWINPIQAGRDRRILDAMLRDVASRGVFVSTHPDVIDRMGTKEVLYRTRDMGWGSDTRLYPSPDAMRSVLLDSLIPGAPRVLKQIRGHSGGGIWKLELPKESTLPVSLTSPILARHAERGSVEQAMPLRDFLDLCRPYVDAGGGMIDQPYQTRLTDGMIRCYVVDDTVAGFGEQLINALYPAPAGASVADAPQPGPRLYYPPTRPDFQRLKHKLEREWIAELCARVGVARTDLPVLWDADFMYGPKDDAGLDTFVLCEINVSSVYPYPPDAMAPLAEATLARARRAT
jgi:hypothetical protein